MIPATLVHLLLGHGGGASSDAKLTVGAAPASFPAELAPAAPAHPIGGVSGRIETVAIFSDSGAEPLSAYSDRLRSAGWHPPTYLTTSGFQSTGDRFGVLCRDSALVMPQLLTGPDRRRYIAITWRTRDAGQSTCNVMDPPRRSAPARDTELTIPLLTSPAGITARRASSSSGGGRAEATGQVRDTTMAPAALAKFYVNQLVAAGWSVNAGFGSNSAAMTVLDAHDASGRPWSGLLTVTTRGAWRDVRLTMRLTEER